MANFEGEKIEDHRLDETHIRESSEKETVNEIDEILNKPNGAESNSYIAVFNSLEKMYEQSVENSPVVEEELLISNNTEDASNVNKIGQEKLQMKSPRSWTQSPRRNEIEINVKEDKLHTYPVPSTSHKDLSVPNVNTNYPIPSISNDVTQIKLHADQTPCLLQHASGNEQLEKYWRRVSCSNEKRGYSELCYINPEITEKVHISDSSQPSFFCKYCGYGYYTSRELKYHLTGDHNIKKYVCDICKIPFEDLTLLRTHFMKEHPIGQFICCFCSWSNFSANRFQQHIRVKHLGQKCLTPCRTCNENLILQEKYSNIITCHRQ